MREIVGGKNTIGRTAAVLKSPIKRPLPLPFTSNLIQPFSFWFGFHNFTIRLKSRQRPELRQKRLYLHWGPHSLLFKRYRDSVQKVKQPGREVDHSPPSSVKVIDRLINVRVRGLKFPMHLRLI